ncbi:hypothetical protein KKB11_03040, partial [Candidatus Micrarchaeota archaeon]|nr:hypothetical protein [Candidatus Micrarchaeota archaeon]
MPRRPGFGSKPRIKLKRIAARRANVDAKRIERMIQADFGEGKSFDAKIISFFTKASQKKGKQIIKPGE